jgi:3-methyladenine DNA glycosylase AlkD
VGEETEGEGSDEVRRIVDDVVGALRAAGRPERAENEKRYLKSDLVHWGASVGAVRAAERAALPRRARPGHDLVVGVAEALWSEPVHERRLAAAFTLADHVAALGPADLPVVERLLREARTWALVDVLAPAVVGPIVAANPEAAAVLDRWCDDPDHWLRRASVLALLGPLRAGGGDWERFTRYADRLWLDKEFFVRKALGWVLRDTARKRPDLVFEWVLPRAATASGVTIRELVKPLSPAQQAEIARARTAHR